ncbi:MAG: MerR family transcriptional regulator [Anaerolineales bacterium]|nr:MerR family transcriptional regulator [Anaerolineales bacterium]
MTDEETTLYYNLGAVTRETGLHPDTLRAWERRYQLPQPTRSDGGQRLYSQRDLQIVKWLINKQEAGLRISQAADLWHTQIAAGIDPLEELEAAASQPAPPMIGGDNMAAYRSAWVKAALSFDSAAADYVITEAFSLFPPEAVCLEIMFGGLNEIGEQWYHGNATVQQEHFASALISRRLNALIAGTALPSRKETIVLAAPPEEDHMLASLLINYLLRRRGYEVIFLGADVPVRDFRSTIEELNPTLVILIANLLQTAASLLDLANQLAGLRIKLAYGGPIFNRVPELRERIPGHFMGEDLEQIIPSIEKILKLPDVELEEIKAEVPDYLEKLRQSLPEIERHLAEIADNYPVIVSAPTSLISRYLLSAIKLGDIRYLESDLEWVAGLLSNFQMPEDLLTRFLTDYARTLQDVVGDPAAEIITWLDEITYQINHVENGK